jgi:hypothetical protein
MIFSCNFFLIYKFFNFFLKIIRELLKTKVGKRDDLNLNSEAINKYLAKNKLTFNLLVCLRRSFINETKLNQFLKQKK